MSGFKISPFRRLFHILFTLSAIYLFFSLTNIHLPVPTACAAGIFSMKSEKEEKPIQILLIGHDQSEDNVSSRADSIILCTFHQNTKQVIMTSFLRDLYLPIPEHDSNRLNAAYAMGGMSLLKETLETNFDLEIDGCVEVDFSQFADILDLLGGVTISLRQDEADYINKAVPGNLKEGMQLLNGHQALTYTRIRKLDADGDFSRTTRQRTVLCSLLRSYKEANVFTILSVLSDILPMLSSDMEEREIISTIIKLLPMVSGCSVTEQSVPTAGNYSYDTVHGMSVLTADMVLLKQQLQESLSSESQKAAPE